MINNKTKEETKGGDGEWVVYDEKEEKQESKNGKGKEKGSKKDKLKKSIPARLFNKLDMCSKPCRGGYKKYGRRHKQ